MSNLTINSSLSNPFGSRPNTKPVLTIFLTSNGKSAATYTAIVGDSEASSANSLNAIALAVLAALADTETIEFVELNGVQVKLIDLVNSGVNKVLGKSNVGSTTATTETTNDNIKRLV